VTPSSQPDVYKIWGFSPFLTQSSGLALPTNLDFPSLLQPKSFIGRDSLEYVLGRDGFLYQLHERDELSERSESGQKGSWVRVENCRGGWIDVAILGTGDWIGIQGKFAISRIETSLSERNLTFLTSLAMNLPEYNPHVIYAAPSMQNLFSQVPFQLTSLLPPPTESSRPLPTFAQLHASTSHVLISPSLSSSHTSPPHAYGSNLHSQLSTSFTPSSSTASRPINLPPTPSPILQTSGNLSSLFSLASNELFVWGGPFGTLSPDHPLDLSSLSAINPDSQSDEDEREPADLSAAAVSSTGGIVLGFEDGRVLQSGIGKRKEDWGPSVRIEREVENGGKGKDGEEMEWEEVEGMGAVGERREEEDG
jgi:hypothetical protein